MGIAPVGLNLCTCRCRLFAKHYTKFLVVPGAGFSVAGLDRAMEGHGP